MSGFVHSRLMLHRLVKSVRQQSFDVPPGQQSEVQCRVRPPGMRVRVREAESVTRQQ
jgi:hypothetical protein